MYKKLLSIFTIFILNSCTTFSSHTNCITTSEVLNNAVLINHTEAGGFFVGIKLKPLNDQCRDLVDAINQRSEQDLERFIKEPNKPKESVFKESPYSRYNNDLLINHRPFRKRLFSALLGTPYSWVDFPKELKTGQKIEIRFTTHIEERPLVVPRYTYLAEVYKIF